MKPFVRNEDQGGGIPEWVVTFGDMMSLLLTFFIMLVSLSEIKEELEKIDELLHGALSGPTNHGTPVTGIVFGDGTGNPAGRGFKNYLKFPGWAAEADGTAHKAERLNDVIPNSHILDQYKNASNPKAHDEGTGMEIIRQCEGRLDKIVIGAGTGGTITGTATYLKERKPELMVVGVDPQGSIYTAATEDDVTTYLIEGVGEDFWPETYDPSITDRYEMVTDAQAFAMTRRLAVEEGDRVSVFPIFEALDITPVLEVRERPLRRTRFVLDTHLGRLATYLRLLGFDALYRNDAADDALARFDADFALMGLELSRFIPAVVDAFGGLDED